MQYDRFGNTFSIQIVDNYTPSTWTVRVCSLITLLEISQHVTLLPSSPRLTLSIVAVDVSVYVTTLKW